MRSKRGFTILELTVVIAVIAILATILIPSYSGVIGDASRMAALTEARDCYACFLKEHATDADFSRPIFVLAEGEIFNVTDGQVHYTEQAQTESAEALIDAIDCSAHEECKSIKTKRNDAEAALALYREFKAAHPTFSLPVFVLARGSYYAIEESGSKASLLSDTEAATLDLKPKSDCLHSDHAACPYIYLQGYMDPID